MIPAPTVADGLLAFDTSTEQLAVGLLSAGRRWTADLPGGAQASRLLLPAARELLQRAGTSLPHLAAVAFGRGPGAFTGLRTSCAVAQGLALGLRLPVLPLDSLMLVAEQVRQQADLPADGDVGVAMDARMGELYSARYRWRGGVWQVVQPPGLWSAQVLAAAWAAAPPSSMAGTGRELLGAAWPRSSPGPQWAPVGDPRAPALLALAERAWQAGASVDAADALPLYLRDKVALTTDERAAIRPGRGA